MAITINNLLSCVGLDAKRIKTVKWGEAIPCSSIGIYIVSTSSNPASNNGLLSKAPIDKNILNFWLNKVPKMEIDKKMQILVVYIIGFVLFGSQIKILYI